MDESVAALAVELVEALTSAGFKCAIGGAIALGFWAVPRGTIDVDVTVFVEEDSELTELAVVLDDLGCELDRQEFVTSARRDGAATARKYGWRVDVFVPSIPFYDEVRARVTTATLRGIEIPILDAESLAVFKLLFFRSKDIVDLKQLVGGRPELDTRWVRDRVAEMLGEDDPRIERWDDICDTHHGS